MVVSQAIDRVVVSQKKKVRETGDQAAPASLRREIVAAQGPVADREQLALGVQRLRVTCGPMATPSNMTSREPRSDGWSPGRVQRVLARGQMIGRRSQSCRALTLVGAVVGFLLLAAGEASSSFDWSAPLLVDRAVPRDSLSLGLQGMWFPQRHCASPRTTSGTCSPPVIQARIGLVGGAMARQPRPRGRAASAVQRWRTVRRRQYMPVNEKTMSWRQCSLGRPPRNVETRPGEA